MITGLWEWPAQLSNSEHPDRVALMREIAYQMTQRIGENGHLEQDDSRTFAQALSLNISSGGMLLLMQEVPEVGRVMRIQVPTPVQTASTPTLAEVRWQRKLPFGGREHEISLVGIKFLF